LPATAAATGFVLQQLLHCSRHRQIIHRCLQTRADQQRLATTRNAAAVATTNI
jgi:hypothetical protein